MLIDSIQDRGPFLNSVLEIKGKPRVIRNR
jgi:hypothetical protein